MLNKELKNWRMNYQDYRNIACTAPCSMYSVLLENKLIPDPFYRLNEQEATKLSNFPCEFSATFDVSEEEYKQKHAELIFQGLDTLCSIYLNGKLLGKTQNMHMAYCYDVKELLCLGENVLKLSFESPVQYFEKMNNRHYLQTNPDTIKGAGHLRKVLSMSGWDWGPTLPDMGIFRPVELQFYSHPKITDFFIYQKHENNEVELEITVQTSETADIYVQIDRQKVLLENGTGTIKIRNPKLWWPNGYGEQYLYDISFEAVSDGKTVDSISKRIGLRTMELSTPQDEIGREFCLMVNGEKIFAMGANYVPEDSLLPRITPNKTRKLLESCVDANYNCIRIWGGGYYPNEFFYDQCDELGLIVWQDFGIACCDVWLRESFKQSITDEIIYNLKRLRHHASLGLFCGNNEVEEKIVFETDELIKLDYLQLYERIFPDLCEKYAPQTAYWPSSPSCGGGFKTPGKPEEGDVHFWTVWHGSAPFTDYRKYKFRFCSEFGFESFPSYKTVKSFCAEEDLNPFSAVMENHQKCKGGNMKILSYISKNYLYPTSLENLIYASQLVQADAIKYGVEYFRSIRGCCMGSIYWQLNDCWPVASWSSVDYFGRYKALHYAAKKFYAPLLTGLFEEKGVLSINVSNETREEKSGHVKYGVYDSDFGCKMSGEQQFTVKKLSSEDIIKIDVSEFEGRHDVFFVADTYDSDGNFVMRQTLLFAEPKHYHWKKPNIAVNIKKNGEYTEFHVTSDCFAKSVEIDFKEYDLILSDNYFDITDSVAVVISAKTDVPIDKLEKSLQIRSVYDIR